MLKKLQVVFFCCAIYFLAADVTYAVYLQEQWILKPDQWTWMGGSSHTPANLKYGVYGIKGVAEVSSMPGARSSAVTWKDQNGNFWLFGGLGSDAHGSSGCLNDLWKWDGAYWTWIGGSDLANQAGSYGTKGVAEASNVPPARFGAVTWKDQDGNLWLFGGDGHGSSGGMYYALNDLWKWDGTNWTWVSGSNLINQPGTYGIKGVAEPANIPGARYGAVSWMDTNGNLWLFGGSGYDLNGIQGYLNDLWKWDGANWTWVSGSNVTGSGPTYGTRGLPDSKNVPGASVDASSWTDASGNFWLFDGNNIWKWDGTNWTCLPYLSPSPAGRSRSAAWTDSEGNIWLFGGYGLDSGQHYGRLNDLWKWNGVFWTLVSGSNTVDSFGIYGTKGIASSANVPGARENAASWVDSSGNLWLFGGFGYDSTDYDGSLNDLWKWDGANWIWVSGPRAMHSSGTYGIKGVSSAANIPAARSGASSWKDGIGDLWLFGGSDYYYQPFGYRNDLWKWDGTNWTWISGANTESAVGIYGTKGIPNQSNGPGGRSKAAEWVDRSGNLWLFGGIGHDAYSGHWPSYLNDLWKWDGTYWTWISGSDSVDAKAVFGIKGVSSSANVPGPREGAVSWTDPSGNFWLFGGRGFWVDFGGYLNDLWKWDGTYWTWISGSDTDDSPGVYGTKGVASPTNVPGAREHAVSWIDGSGNFWLFGGMGRGRTGTLGELNDLWKWDGTNWKWVSGSDSVYQPNVYGTRNVADEANVPGGRNGGVGWVDAFGNLWMFGDPFIDKYYRNDLWKWDGANWTWMGGSDLLNQSGIYGTMLVPSPLNIPGARGFSTAWTDTTGSIMLFGGLGYDVDGRLGVLNDLWGLGLPLATAPAVVTTPATVIMGTTVTVGGIVTSNGGPSVTSRGLCWGTGANPTINGYCVENGKGTGAFSMSIIGLNTSTTYHVRAYATNSLATSYGEDIQFTTLPGDLPIVSTDAVVVRSSTSALGSGSVGDDGGLTVTDRGLCWSISEYPTTADNHLSAESGIGLFAGELSFLVPGSVYHLRAYATNAVGTSYGADITFFTFCQVNAAKIGSTEYINIQDAIAHVSPNGTIKTNAAEFSEDLLFLNDGPINFHGGYDCTFSSKPGMSILSSIAIKGVGSVTIDNIIIK